MRFYLSPTSPSKAAASHVERCGFAFLMQQQVKSKLLKNSMLGREKETKICCRDIWLRYLHQVPAVVPKVFVEGLRQYFCSFSPPLPRGRLCIFVFCLFGFFFFFFFCSQPPLTVLSLIYHHRASHLSGAVCVCVWWCARACVCVEGISGNFHSHSAHYRQK